MPPIRLLSENCQTIVLTIFVLMIITITIVPLNAIAQETPKGIRVLSTDGKIGFTKYIGLGRSDHMGSSSFDFLIVNNSNETATGISIIKSSLIEKERGKFSTAPSYLGHNYITVSAVENTIAPGGQTQATFTIEQSAIDAIGMNEIMYQGRIQVIGDNFSPVIVDVEVKFIDAPLLYFFVAWAGVAIAIVAGFFYSVSRKGAEITEELKEDINIIHRVNKHIQNINLLRNTVPTQAWLNIYKAYVRYAGEIITGRDDFSLKEDMYAVQWFVEIDNLLRQNNSLKDSPKLIATHVTLPELVVPEVEDPIYGDTVENLAREIKWDYFRQSKTEWIYLAGTLLVAAVAAVVTSATFVGNTIANIIVAISFGFAVYRAQDLLKSLKKPDKEADKD